MSDNDLLDFMKEQRDEHIADVAKKLSQELAQKSLNSGGEWPTWTRQVLREQYGPLLHRIEDDVFTYMQEHDLALVNDRGVTITVAPEGYSSEKKASTRYNWTRS